MSESDSISVVIPTLDEERMVAGAIRSVRAQAEVLVVDGGSHDATCTVARAEGARVLLCGPGRGQQLALGAREARGDWIVFLHADTRLEAGWAEELRTLPTTVVGGAFRFALDSRRRRYRLVEAGVSLRCRLFQLPYGDQAIFVRRGVPERIGGIPTLPLMEDVALVRRLRGAGPLGFPAARAFTSPRQWEDGGFVATTLRNWWLFGLYMGGAAPDRLARHYHLRHDA
jgi:rSAM/selenodomain-associated transferase 2